MSAHFAGRFCSLVGTRALAVLALGLASAYAGAASAQELNFADNTMFQLCSGTTFPGISGGTTSDNFAGVYPSQYQQTQNSSANSLWMIEREGVWNGVVHNTTTCRTWRVNWYDNTEEEFEEWYETTDQVCDRCDGPAVGCTEADYQSPGFYWILASDSSFAHDSGWGVINQDTIADYLEFSTSLENIHLHEHGHNYGLDDVVGIATTMENVEFHYKNINLTQANNDQMWPNDNAQMRARNYEISGGSTRRNFAASVWFRNTSDGTSTRSFPSMITLSYWFAIGDGLDLVLVPEILLRFDWCGRSSV